MEISLYYYFLDVKLTNLTFLLNFSQSPIMFSEKIVQKEQVETLFDQRKFSLYIAEDQTLNVDAQLI